MNTERIILCGPSGSGKTTLANYIAEVFELPFIPGSASLIMTKEDQDALKDKYGYEPIGQKNVVNLSGAKPEFGIDFQKRLLNNRASKLKNTQGGFVTDRSPVDNVTYFLNQCVHNASEEETQEFIYHAKALYENEFTHLIYVKCVNPTPIEDNGSRITNKYFQKKVDSIFEHSLKEYFLPKKNNKGEIIEDSKVKVLILDYWDLQKRKSDVVTFLTDK